jgi:hypothetical protein
MARATTRIVLAKIRGKTLGRMCRVMIWRFPAPRALARSTYGRSLSVRTWARTTRAVAGQVVTPMTNAMTSRLRPRMAASTMARGRKGMTKNQSVKRIRITSTQPPK